MLAHLLLLVLIHAGSRPPIEESAEDAFERLQAAAADPDSDGFRAFLHEGAGRGLKGDELAERCRELAAVLTGWKRSKVREEGDDAAIAMKDGREILEVLMRRHEDQWKLDQPWGYLVEGGALKERNGKKAATIELTMRDSDGSYGTSAYCFAYVTGSGEACKNRVDVWLCHNQDFHAKGKNRVVSLGKGSLRSIDRIPLGVEWGRTARLEGGHTYVVHCLDTRDRDFYVKFRVKGMKRDEVAIEWSLLTTGRGTPASIHKPSSLDTNDGADATDRLCQKTGS